MRLPNPIKNPQKMLQPVQFFIVFLVFFLFQSCSSSDTITIKKPLKDGDVVVSQGKAFALGFFSPGNSKYRYVGIWYAQVSGQTVVWVANRNNPINDTSGVIKINNQGNLALFRSNGSDLVWSTDVSVIRTGTSSIARLNDLGNLVLLDSVKGRVFWQSFDYPTNSMLPFMKLGYTRPNGLERALTSWKSPDDPGSGNFSYRITHNVFPQLILYKGVEPRWRTGTWTGRRWSGVPEMTNNFIFNVTFVNNQDEVSVVYGVTDNSIITRMELNESGIQQRFTWNAREHRWIGFWSDPKEQCDFYGHCGQNGYCDPSHPQTFECICLPGFEPKSPKDWFLRDASHGCKRKRKATRTCNGREGFVKLARVKVPDTSAASVEMGVGLKECEQRCLRNCSCVAYASAYHEIGEGKGCLTWRGDMLDTRTYADAGQDFFVRVDADELAQWTKKASIGKKRSIAIIIGGIAAMVLVIGFTFCFIRRKQRESRMRENSFIFTTSSVYFEDSLQGQENEKNKRNRDLPFFEFSTIAAATNNFSSDNKLGQGGFGSVYKGALRNGMEIAVKRLSRNSGQGVEEFKNEIVLISKLQHRNLVRILGCCVEGEEKMLIYEYLPNKSLDAFIFDEAKKSHLDWNKRFDIICGIARGILYLHQDSRLRIIHRDLKASNVLLDSTMTPKIADFGMSRIFGGDQIEGSTNRIVGTYGYMSPEYAMDGKFSMKSDVYSFGVLLLEIITGRKNSSFYEESRSFNLVGHVWDLWNQGNATKLVDKSLDEAYDPRNEILRGIQIGLLCVQECASERPTMSSVVFMFGNNALDLPSPKRPAFVMRRRGYNQSGVSDPQPSEEAGSSVNDVTISVIHAR